MSRIYLSPPDVGARERELLLDALESGWVAPLGPHVDAFEAEVAARAGVAHAAATISGTAALHLALRIAGVGPGHEVLTSTMTFVATGAAITYLGARPVFVDSEPCTWNVDASLLCEAVEERAHRGRPPQAIVTVDLLGQCADHDPIVDVAQRHGVAVIEDAAEALGATYHGRPAGSLGDMGVFSFNGNKIITTSGGGMLVSANAAAVEEARFLATQARDPAPHYEHSRVGYNYRLSNLLAAVGRAQLEDLDRRITRRAEIRARYRVDLGNLPGWTFLSDAPTGRPNYWLTCVRINPAAYGATREDLRRHLEELDIESRPVWKPMHLQPAFAGFDVVGGAVASEVFEEGLCLPSGSNLSDAEQGRVIDAILAFRAPPNVGASARVRR